MSIYSKGLLEELKRQLVSGWTLDEEHAQIKRIDEVLGAGKGQEKAEEKKQENTPKLANFTLTGSVGKDCDNKIDDVILVQDFLVAFSYLKADNSEVAFVKSEKKNKAETISSGSLSETIKAIKEYQKMGASKSTVKNDKTVLWTGDGKISKSGWTTTSIKAMTEVYNNYAAGPALEEETTVLADDQWRSQFRYGANFSDREDAQEEAYVKFVKEKTGYDDPADLHLAPAEKIKEVKDKYGSTKWYESEELKSAGIKMSQKAREYKPNDVCCFDTSKLMLSFTGASETGSNNKIQTFIKESGTGKLTNQALLGIKYIDGQLRQGKAVMVGIDKGDVKTINETVTDHFIIIAGKYKDGDKWYYHYFDPGTRLKAENGISKGNNRLYIDNNKVEKNSYKLSQVRTNKK